MIIVFFYQMMKSVCTQIYPQEDIMFAIPQSSQMTLNKWQRMMFFNSCSL